MKTEVAIALISLGGVVFTALNKSFDIFLSNRLAKKRKRELLKRNFIALETDKLCLELRENVKADRVYIAKFHNGGSFKTGLPMDKFTVYGEDYSKKAITSLKRKYYATMMTIAPYLFHKLLVEGFCYNVSIEDMLDKHMKDDLLERGTKSLYVFLIKDLSMSPVAFIGVEYICKKAITNTEKSIVWKYHNKFLRLLINK